MHRAPTINDLRLTINKNNSGIASLRSQLHGFFVNRNEILCRDARYCVSTVNKEYGNGD